MKIVLTKDEVKAMVAHRFGAKVSDFTLVISEPRIRKPNELNELVSRLSEANVFRDDTYRVIRHEQLITAIKAFRTYFVDMCGTSPGLADSKYVIEDWNNFYDYSLTHGLPNVSEIASRVWRNVS